MRAPLRESAATICVALGVWLLVVCCASCFAESFVVSGPPDSPPFFWRKGDEARGAGRDLFELLLAGLGFKVEFRVVGSWARALFEVKQGRVDALAACVVAPEATSSLALLEPAMAEDAVTVWVWRERGFRYEGWDDLRGKQGALVRGMEPPTRFAAFAASKLSLERVATPELAWGMLVFGRVRYLLLGRVSGALQAKRYERQEQVEELGPPVYVQTVHLAISKRSPLVEYLPQLEAALLKLHADGVVERLLLKNKIGYEQLR